jgi:hypothetical protein
MKQESDREIDKLNEASGEYLQRINTEAVKPIGPAKHDPGERVRL